jgi:large subunit ribosomal protein L17
MAEKIITLGRRGDLHARRQAMRFVFDPKIVKKVFDDIGPRMATRPGGYLRITGMEPRKGDGAKMATIELVDYVDAPPTPRPQRVTAAPTASRATAAAAIAPSAAEAVEAEAEVEEIEATAETQDIVDEASDEAEETAEAVAEESIDAAAEADAAGDEAPAAEDGDEKAEA